jgi:hypothetical protein
LLLHPGLVAHFGDLASLAEDWPACGREAESSTPAAQMLQQIETRCVQFAKEGLAIYGRKTGTHTPFDDPSLWSSVCPQVHAAAALAGIEAEFSQPWPEEAKLVLPSKKPPIHSSEIWGPVLACCVLEGMAQVAGGKDTASTALALFDRLRLREPLARAFSGGEQVSEDGWRAAARVRLIFLGQTLTPARTAKAAAADSFAGLPRGLWDDDNARWLLKVHEAGGEFYFNKELHQQMLWWVQLPDLLELATPGKTPRRPAVPARVSLASIEQRVEAASEQAEEAGYVLGKKKAAKPVKREKGALTQ